MSHSTRIVVVGAGIVGASVAYHLARRGVAVVVIDGAAAGSATGAGAGIICPWTNPDRNPAYRLGADGARYYPELISMLAEDGEAGTGYIPTDWHFEEGDTNLTDWCWVAPGSEARMARAIEAALRGQS